jgi:hypothetical protein
MDKSNIQRARTQILHGPMWSKNRTAKKGIILMSFRNYEILSLTYPAEDKKKDYTLVSDS